MSPRPRRPRPTARTAVLLVAAALLTGLLASCTSPAGPPEPAEGTPTTTPAPTSAPSPTRTVPDVPVTSADLSSVPVPVVVPPVDLTIASLGIRLPVDPVGVEDDGQMEIPPLAERAGWYRFGAAPGDPDGTSVIAAHVDSVASAGVGPFARLAEVGIGDEVAVERADGQVVRYAVTDVTRVAKPEVAWSDVFDRGGPARLVLVTCGGTFQQQARSYTDNVIVTAEPVGG